MSFQSYEVIPRIRFNDRRTAGQRNVSALCGARVEVAAGNGFVPETMGTPIAGSLEPTANARQRAPRIVPVPETAMNENHFTPTGEYQIRLSWQVGTVQAVAKTEAVDEAPHYEFGPGVLRPDSTHPFRTLRGGESIPRPSSGRHFIQNA